MPDFRIRTQRYRGAIPEARTKAEAEQAEVKIKSKVYERKYGKISASRNFAEFVNSTYLPWARANKRSSRDDELHANVFCRRFGKKALNEIDQQMIEDFKVKRMKTITRYGRQRKPASVNRELAILSGIFTMAVDYEEISKNPCRKIEALPENNQRTRHLSFDEEDRLFAALTRNREHLRTLVTVAIYSRLNFTFHDLRHTFGTRLADAGVDVVKIKELTGHSSIVTTMRYIHATDQGKRGAITVLSEYRQQRRRKDGHKLVTTEKRQALAHANSSIKPAFLKRVNFRGTYIGMILRNLGLDLCPLVKTQVPPTCLVQSWSTSLKALILRTSSATRVLPEFCRNALALYTALAAYE